MRIRVCDSDTGGMTASTEVDTFSTVADFFRNQKPGANSNDYTVLINSRPAKLTDGFPDGCMVTISRKKMTGADHRAA